MDYPKKFIAIQSGHVVGSATLWVSGTSFSGPAGSQTVEVAPDNPVDVGWTAVFNDESQKWEYTAP